MKLVKELETRDPKLAKQVAQVLTASVKLKDFQTPEYQAYKYGKPHEAAKQLEQLIKNIVKEVQESLKVAGPFLAPALLAAFTNELGLVLKKVQIPKSKSLDEVLREKGISKEQFNQRKKAYEKKALKNPPVV